MTNSAPYLPNGKAYTNVKLGRPIYGWKTTTRIRQAPWPPRLKVKATRSRDQSEPAVLVQWPINRKRIVVVSPKLAGVYPVTRVTLRTSFKVKKSKVRVTGRLTPTRITCHIFRTVRHTRISGKRHNLQG